MSYETKPVYLTCPTCLTRHVRNAGWRYGEFCSTHCELVDRHKRRLETERKVERAARMYPNQKRAAEATGISYPHFRRVVKRLALREYFPAQGGAATWA